MEKITRINFLSRRSKRGVLALSLISIIAGCSSKQDAPETDAKVEEPVAEAAAPTGLSDQCASLATLSGDALGEPTARITSAVLQPALEAEPNGPTPWQPGLPALNPHCEVFGALRERTGSDGQQYAVKFHLRLPETWNGRFLYEGGGGTNGLIGDAVGKLPGAREVGLNQGFAVVSTDTGHDNDTNANLQVNGTVAFGQDYEARLEYAEKALDSVATVGKQVVGAFYGREPEYNYFAGCSNGGREGMVFAQRFPQQFDGILALAPAFAVPKASVAEAWDTQVFSAVAEALGHVKENGLPDLAKSYSNTDLALVANAVKSSCDELDGLADGMVNAVMACTTAQVRPQLEKLVCEGDKTDSCLVATQVDALIKSFEGPRNSQGEALYSAWPWDPGIGDMGWRIWKIGMPGAMPAINTTLGAQAMAGLFVTPPDTIAATPDAGQRYQMDYSLDTDAPRIFATTDEFPRSGWDLVGAKSPDLSAFREQGGKLLVPHGAGDPIFSVYDTINWWRDVDSREEGRAADFVRVFNVPGMGHCAGGPSTDQFDALGALTDWVESGSAPDRIEASAGPRSPWPNRERPLCVFPKMAVYTEGDPEKSASFACAEPAKD